MLVFIARRKYNNSGFSDINLSAFQFWLSLMVDTGFDHQTVHDAFESAFKQFKQSPEEFAKRRWDDPIQARLPGWVVTSSGDWETVLLHLKERLPEQLQVGRFNLPVQKPERWDQFCKRTDHLLVTWGRFQLARPGPFLDYEIRRLNAVCECLRAGDDHLDVAGFADFRGPLTARANVLTLPLEKPWAEGRANFGPSGPYSFGADELVLPEWPIPDPETMAHLEGRGLRPVLRWLLGRPMNAASRGLDAFEAARTIGGAYGLMPVEVEQGWKLAALCTCLEKLFHTRKGARDNKRVTICDCVRSRLDKRAADIVWDAFDLRNRHIHDAEFEMWTDFDSFYNIVRKLVAHELRKAAS